jgi:hypothetical protein
MHTLTLVLLLLAAYCLWPFALAFATAGACPVGWPYVDGNDPGDVMHKGGSAPKPPKQKEQKLPAIPEQQPLPPPPPPPPPPVENMAEVDQAKADEKRKAARAQGLKSTLLAGETGGYAPAQPDGAKKSLLG